MLMLMDTPDVPDGPQALCPALTASAAGSSPCAVSQAMLPGGYTEGFHGFLSIRTELSHSGIPCPTRVIIHLVDLTLHYLQMNLMFKHGQST